MTKSNQGIGQHQVGVAAKALRWSMAGAFAVIGLGVLASGCATEAPAEETTEVGETADALISNDNVRRALAYGQDLVGTPYGWWFSGPLPAGTPMWTAGGAAPDAGFVRARAANCSGLMNLLLRSVGKPIPSTAFHGTGGTGAYGAYYRAKGVAQRFDINRNYPAGTLIGRYYRDTFDQGHVAVILANGRVLQSFANVRGGSFPGVNTGATVAQSHDGGFYEYAVLPQDWLGGAGGGSDGSGNDACASGDGVYCGKNGVPGVASVLYRCNGGKVAPAQACVNGCVGEAPGTDDHCASAPTCAHGDGFYCGGNGVSGISGSLYRCTAGRIKISQDCSNGCQREAPGVDDHCK